MFARRHNYDTLHLCTEVSKTKKQNKKRGEKYNTLHRCKVSHRHNTIHYISAEVSHTVRHATPVQRFPYCTIHYIRAEVSHTVRYTLSVQYSERFPPDRNTMHCIRVRRFPYRYCTIHYISVVLFPHRYKYDPIHQRNFLQPAYDTLRQCRGFPQT